MTTSSPWRLGIAFFRSREGRPGYEARLGSPVSTVAKRQACMGGGGGGGGGVALLVQ